jgi:hypothetical protein
MQNLILERKLLCSAHHIRGKRLRTCLDRKRQWISIIRESYPSGFWIIRRRAGFTFALIAMAVLIGDKLRGGVSSSGSGSAGSEPCGMRSLPVHLEFGQSSTGNGGAVNFPDGIGSQGLGHNSVSWITSTGLRHLSSSVTSPHSFKLGMKILVLSATRNIQREPALALIKETLIGHSIPYDEVALTSGGKRLSDAKLELECENRDGKACGKYYGVVLTSDMLAFQDSSGAWASALTPGQWQQLRDYESRFRVRRVAIAAFPREIYGVAPAGDPVTADNSLIMLPSAARFSSGLVKGVTLPLSGSFQNPARISDPSIAEPIGVFGNAVAVIGGNAERPVAATVTRYPNGREQLNFYFAQSVYLSASRYTSALWVNWITRGIYQGERRIYLNLQIDDVFMPNAMWSMVRLAGTEDGYADYRATADDFDELLAWQRDIRSRLPRGSTFRLEMAPNGNGVWETEDYAVDSLFHKMRTMLDEFFWVSHTFSHPDLDKISARRMVQEIRNNQLFLEDLLGKDHPNFSPHSVITPHISGLFNRNALMGLYETGIHNVVGDNSRRELWPANPYEGYFTGSDPNGFEGIFVIPRQATVAPVSAGPMRYLHSFYNNLYKGYWGRELSSSQIMQLEALRVARLLMAWRHDPYMFHQGNLWVFDWDGVSAVTGRRRQSVLTLWVEFVLGETLKFMELPILSAKMDDMANLLQERMDLDECNAATIASVESGEIKELNVSADFSCIVPLTGIESAALNGRSLEVEEYGPDRTVHFSAGNSEAGQLKIKAVKW